MAVYGVVLFASTRGAMQAEKIVQEQQIAARIIPTPVQLRGTCGFALKYALSEEKALISLLAAQQIAYEGLYHASGTGTQISYSKVPE